MCSFLAVQNPLKKVCIAAKKIFQQEKNNRAGGAKPPVFSSSEVGMYQYLLIPFLVG
jgi:hypothetical protein